MNASWGNRRGSPTDPLLPRRLVVGEPPAGQSPAPAPFGACISASGGLPLFFAFGLLPTPDERVRELDDLEQVDDVDRGADREQPDQRVECDGERLPVAVGVRA